MHKVAVCICTRGRPQMFARCLDSVVKQIVPSNIEFKIIVVENDSVQRVKALAFSANAVYTFCAPLGIAYVRNVAMVYALHRKADWIVFIDDDEVAHSNWLAKLMSDEYLDTPVLQGFRYIIYPDKLPFWCIDKSHVVNRADEGKLLQTAATYNVRFSSDIPKSGIVFNEIIAFGGGEDTDFFQRARAAGFKIKYTCHAVTQEAAHLDRLTYWYQIYRAFWGGAAGVFAARSVHDTFWTYTHKLYTIPINIVSGIVNLALAPFYCLTGLYHFKRKAISGGRKLATAFGRLCGFVGIVPQAYKKVSGS